MRNKPTYKELEEMVKELEEERKSRKKVEQGLKQYQGALEAAGDSIYMVDSDCRYIFANKEHLSRLKENGRISRESRDEIVGKKFGNIHPEEDLKVFKENVEKVFKTSRSYMEEHKFLGGKRWSSRTYSPVKNRETGEVESVVVVSKDITISKKTEEDLSQYSKRLEAANKELNSFSYIISHDLKEPLRAIKNFSQFLMEDYSEKIGEKGKDYLKRITAGAARMQNLIDALLALSRVSQRKQSYESVDSGKLVKRAISQLKPMIEEKNVKIKVNGELPFIYCEPVQIEQVFYNLITNAIKYNDKSRPEVEIGSQGKKQITFFVKDNGIGIKKEHFDDVFQLFTHLHDREAYGGGTGAGLAIVKKIIEEHGGKIWVESEEGKGCTFLFTLPKTRKEA